MIQGLFNEKLILEESNKLQLTEIQKESAINWIDFLKKGYLDEEKGAYIEFANTILKDILGFQIDITHLKHEEKHMEFLFKNLSGEGIVVFEAKGAKTKDLWAYQGRDKKERSTPVNQINSYLYEEKIHFGVLTNYREFVLFNRNEGSKKFYRFDFLDIEKDSNKLKEFIYLFSKNSLLETNKVEELKEESKNAEREFTKEFYKIFHETRLMILKEFEESGVNKESAIHYSQLFLNRLMFIFFAEDRGLLDRNYFENAIFSLLENGDRTLNASSFNVCDTISGLFGQLDNQIPLEIHGFNGELFKEKISRDASFRDFRNKDFFKDCIQSSKLKTKDNLNEKESAIFVKYQDRISLIVQNIIIMASFDFKEQVNVEILGHIFEQSISDLEELKNEGVSKRKKDGVFYTPEYITDYICRNTIIPYLSKSGKSEVGKLVFEYIENIEELENKFRNIKILDPACGSGAFLIKSVDIMMEIFDEIQRVKQEQGEYSKKKLTKREKEDASQLSFKKFEEQNEIKEIIENSIFGVDINEESVEITKLALFLKLVKKGKKLINLSRNIKKGNSLVDDKSVDERAFDWDKEFPFKFDVVIGNPPYVSIENLNPSKGVDKKEFLKYLSKNYASMNKRSDLANLFIEKSLSFLSERGIYGQIVPNRFITNISGQSIKEIIKNSASIVKLINFGENKVFEDADAYTCILILTRKNLEMYDYYKFSPLKLKTQISEYLSRIENYFKKNSNQKMWELDSSEDISLKNKLFADSLSLSKIAIANQGIKSGNDSIFILREIGQKGSIKILKNENNEVHVFENDIIKPLLSNTEIKNYKLQFNNNYVIYPYKDNKIIPEQQMKKDYPLCYSYLLKYKQELSSRKSLTKTDAWFSIIRKRDQKIFEENKILTPDTAIKPSFCYDINKYYYVGGLGIRVTSKDYNPLYVLCILNSRLSKWYIETISRSIPGGYFSYEKKYSLDIPIKTISSQLQEIFIKKAESMLEMNNDFFNKKNKFLTRIQELGVEKVSRNLDNFFSLSFSEFLKEIEKQKVELNLKQKEEWEDYFEGRKKELSELKIKIDETDEEINRMVYSLYKLSEEEINVIVKNK